MARYAEPGLCLLELPSLDDFDRKAGRPNVISPPAAAPAVRVFGDGEFWQPLRSERVASCREHRHSGERAYKAAPCQWLHEIAHTSVKLRNHGGIIFGGRHENASQPEAPGPPCSASATLAAYARSSKATCPPSACRKTALLRRSQTQSSGSDAGEDRTDQVPDLQPSPLRPRCGRQPFKEAGAKIIAHRRAKDRLAALKPADVPIPDEVVDQKRTITLGGTTLELIYVGRNHSDCWLVMLLPKEKIDPLRG